MTRRERDAAPQPQASRARDGGGAAGPTHGEGPETHRGTYHVWTIGCQMNVADSQRLAGELEALGYRWSERAEDADVIVLNSCVVRQQAEDKVVGRLTSLAPVKRARPDTVIALMGCLVAPRTVDALGVRFPDVDVFMRPSDPAPLVAHLDALARESAARSAESRRTARTWAAQDDMVPGAIRVPEHERGKLVSAHVPVVYGCNLVCSYCVIPSRRGPERSRPMDEIEAHVHSLVDQGVREVTLLGQIVDRYGHDLGDGSGLAGLLARLDRIDGLSRIRFLTSHPGYLSDDLLDAVADLPRVMEHVEVPVQAGHDAVLGRMRRGYAVDDYRRLVERIRRRVPGVAVHTDVIVGFCGETEEEFDATYRLLEELRLDKAHIAKYSPRPGTVAALRLADDVTPEEKEGRRRALDELQTSICAEKNRALLGASLEVLVESRDGERWRGRTRTNKLVFFESNESVLGRLVDVSIDWAGPWSMLGQPRHKDERDRWALDG